MGRVEGSQPPAELPRAGPADPPPPHDLLLRSLDAALAGHASTVLLCGPKAREVGEHGIAAAADRGAKVVKSVCSGAGDDDRLGGWRRVSRELDAPLAPSPCARSRISDFERFARALRASAAASGLVVALEALDRADLDTLLLCRIVGGLPAGARSLLLGSYDEGLAEDAGLNPPLGEVIRQTGARVIRAA